MLKIQNVTREKSDYNRYCGPAVISALTGMNTGEAARLIRSVSSYKAVRGTSTGVLHSALRQCGISCSILHLAPSAKKAPTLAQWLRDTHGTRGGKVFLVVAGNHWQLVSGNRYVCGISGKVVGFEHKAVKKRSRVTEVYELTAASVKIPAKARKVSKVDPDYAAFRKLAQQQGFSYKVENEGGVKYLDIEPFGDFVEGIHTLHYDWSESLERVGTALANPEYLVDGYISY